MLMMTITGPLEMSEPDLPTVSSNNALSKIGGSLRTLASDAMKTTAGNAAALASQVKAPFTNKNMTVLTR